MPPELEITLPDNVILSFYPENTPLEKMVKLASTLDFMEEIEIMKKVGFSPPMNLLIYDNYLALGLYHTGDGMGVGIRPYSDEMLKTWIDIALSLRKHPIRVIDKTQKENFTERLKPRTGLDWIEYDSQILREIKDKHCKAQKYLESVTLSKDLYAVLEFWGKVEVMHWRIKDYSSLKDPKTLIEGIICELQGKQRHDPPIENIEKMLKEKHPEALIMREPLRYCSCGDESKPWSCLAHLFEKAYAKQIGLKGKIIPVLKSSSEGYLN